MSSSREKDSLSFLNYKNSQSRQEWLKQLYNTHNKFSPDSVPLDQTFSSYEKFKNYADQKEYELWNLFTKLDKNKDLCLDKSELSRALESSDINVSETNLDFFIQIIDSNQDGVISYKEWRDFLILSPSHSSLPELYRFVKSQYSRPASSVFTPDADSAPHQKPTIQPESPSPSTSASASASTSTSSSSSALPTPSSLSSEKMPKSKPQIQEEHVHQDHGQSEEEEEETEETGIFSGAGKFLLAGGVAGAISRTCTAPFDRLKIYMSTKAPDRLSVQPVARHSFMLDATKELYAQNGLRAFFVGNGLNVLKILPESALKFLTYESSKRFFVRYVDKCQDSSELSAPSRFMAGGFAGILSQLIIYPLETLKTRVMSSTGQKVIGNALVIQTAKLMWVQGGFKPYFRGLTWGLIGVFPYSAIDMSVYHSLKVAYAKSIGEQEPGVFSSLSFGAISGATGASCVYPLNLIRTRLQAQGTPVHTQTYTGFQDCVYRTYKGEGFRGFYKGLAPTLLKVVPSVAISWATYETLIKCLFKNHHVNDE